MFAFFCLSQTINKTSDGWQYIHICKHMYSNNARRWYDPNWVINIMCRSNSDFHCIDTHSNSSPNLNKTRRKLSGNILKTFTTETIRFCGCSYDIKHILQRKEILWVCLWQQHCVLLSCWCFFPLQKYIGFALWLDFIRTSNALQLLQRSNGGKD